MQIFDSVRSDTHYRQTWEKTNKNKKTLSSYRHTYIQKYDNDNL